jgi:MinD-like ATPase involved in chromosome partitioning or flagellar assembly
MKLTGAGRIVTFYSYKGGTGRTMALSNVAWILAGNGHDVLVIDWDLEAPGLHRYLRPFLIDPELSSTPGLIDFMWDVARVNMTPTEEAGPSRSARFPSLEDYVVGLDWDFGGNGSISFLPAGRQDENYAQRVNTFDWDHFYERLGGGKLLEVERRALRANYDYILIDSRTGVSDTSSICTVHMPDLLAVFFTLNRQSIKGAAAVARSISDQREDGFRIFPVPTRVENAEEDKKLAAIKYARRTFAPLLMHVQSNRSRILAEEQLQYWNDVETPYRTYYAFEEVPAAFKEEAGSRGGLLAANERIAYWITDRAAHPLPPISEARREAVVATYGFREQDDRTREPISRPSGLESIAVVWGRLRWTVARRPWLFATACALWVGLLVGFVSWQQVGFARGEARKAEQAAAVSSQRAADARQEAETSLKNAEMARQDADTARAEFNRIKGALLPINAQLDSIRADLRKIAPLADHDSLERSLLTMKQTLDELQK